MALSRATRRLAWIGVPVVLIGLLVVFWRWDWFIPIVEARASAAIGRAVTIEHLHVRLGRVVEVTADGVVVANPPDWPDGDPPFVAMQALTVQADAWGYIRGHGLVLPMVGVDAPTVWATETATGAANFRLSTGSGSGGATTVKVGDIRIADGNAHVVIPRLKTDFQRADRDPGQRRHRQGGDRCQGHICGATDHRSFGWRCAAVAA